MMARKRSIYLSQPDCSVIRKEKSGERDCGSKALGYSDENHVEKG